MYVYMVYVHVYAWCMYCVYTCMYSDMYYVVLHAHQLSEALYVSADTTPSTTAILSDMDSASGSACSM